MTTNELELWQKIEEFQFDKSDIKLTFAKRLARENNISERFANEIIEEYKKFIFLCCVSAHQVTPSHFVDLAWHLHLTYTKSYWIDLCKNTIGKEIHHNPTEGGAFENIKFKNFYKDTISLYKEKFNGNPPIHIWQNDVERFKIAITNIDTNKNWIIPKPSFIFRKPHFSVSGIFVFLSVILYSCSKNSGIALSIIGFFIIFIVIIFAVNKKSSQRESNGDTSSSSGCGFLGNAQANDGVDHDAAGGDGGDGGCSGCGGGCSGS